METDENEFRQIVAAAIDSLPAQLEHMKNVAIVVEDEPNANQMQKLHLYHGRLLFGLYEGIPLTRRGNNYNLVLPDKITIFKRPLERISRTIEELRHNVRQTVWHEIAHHYGLNHEQISRLEAKAHPL